MTAAASFTGEAEVTASQLTAECAVSHFRDENGPVDDPGRMSKRVLALAAAADVFRMRVLPSCGARLRTLGAHLTAFFPLREDELRIEVRTGHEPQRVPRQAPARKRTGKQASPIVECVVGDSEERSNDGPREPPPCRPARATAGADLAGFELPRRHRLLPADVVDDLAAGERHRNEREGETTRLFVGQPAFKRDRVADRNERASARADRKGRGVERLRLRLIEEGVMTAGGTSGRHHQVIYFVHVGELLTERPPAIRAGEPSAARAAGRSCHLAHRVTDPRVVIINVTSLSP
jgi:hypothetical protein